MMLFIAPNISTTNNKININAEQYDYFDAC